ncbi:MAG: hypothetical protein PHS04_15075 [Tissierellia bacterium]|nr:hypothetical protein [Tissierellia bacterium]
METWKQHIAANSRHKLLFIKREIEDISFVDVGTELSAAIEHILHEKRLSMVAEEALDKIIDQYTIQDPDIGDYVAIRNIGILFEPALHINLHAKVDSWSRTRVLIIHHEGTIHNHVFFLTTNSEIKYSLNLKDITYKTL